MRLDSFPEIESSHKLPREVIIKGAASDFDPEKGAELRGIVINNIGQAIKNIKVQAVIFDEDHIPILSTSVLTDPPALQQGGIANFVFHLDEISEPIKHFYLHANWGFDETE